MRHAAAHFGIPWSRYQLIGVTELAAAGGVLAGLCGTPSASLPQPGWPCCSSAR